MDASFFASLLSAQQVAVFQRCSENSFRLIGQSPAWLDPWLTDRAPTAAIRPADLFLYLDVFLPAAERLWQTPPPAQLRSGIWTETDPSGR